MRFRIRASRHEITLVGILVQATIISSCAVHCPAVVVPGDSEISPAVTQLLDELSAWGITIYDSRFRSWQPKWDSVNSPRKAFCEAEAAASFRQGGGLGIGVIQQRALCRIFFPIPRAWSAFTVRFTSDGVTKFLAHTFHNPRMLPHFARSAPAR